MAFVERNGEDKMKPHGSVHLSGSVIFHDTFYVGCWESELKIGLPDLSFLFFFWLSDKRFCDWDAALNNGNG